ncbi:Cadherin tumor suppressor [Fasciola hepatica]|uniref:Cadherin tumor suppressor n=1 Tax=Fasciola hepatica TaxID=6192 RepID=A0A4E0R7F1_FASHE|nr:Cadherin tumor suppressor [Fasciola hepatica]
MSQRVKFLLVLASCYLIIRLNADTEIVVQYPLTWSNSRRQFNFPVHFRSLKVPVFADWKTTTPTLKSWQYLKTANYEVPRYLREGYWIPNAFRQICIPEAKDKTFADFMHAFTYEDYTKDEPDSIRQYFTNTGRYYDRGYFIILNFLLNVCMCLRKEATDLHCPNPCWRPDVCMNDQYSTGTCLVITDPKQRTAIHSRLRNKLGDIYDYGYQCGCRQGYVFNDTLKKCTEGPPKCDPTRCHNGGICEVLPPSKRAMTGSDIACHCPPAWGGPVCEEPRNPCKLHHRLCGRYSCFRDTNNRIKGYSCSCPPGTRSLSHANPRCVNINECKELTAPCLNGGVCKDRYPPDSTIVRKRGQPFGYTCQCRYGYAGDRCERPPPRLYWSGWSLWSKCSTSCGVGTRVRHRSCPVRNRCTGQSVQSGRCIGPVSYCTESGEDMPPEASGLGTRIVQSWGIGWTVGDDRTLNDAFFWSETETGWPSLYYKDDGYHFGDILTWTKLTQLSRNWSIGQLMIYHAVVLGVLAIPLLFILVSMSKLICSVLGAKKAAKAEGQTEEAQ